MSDLNQLTTSWGPRKPGDWGTPEHLAANPVLDAPWPSDPDWGNPNSGRVLPSPEETEAWAHDIAKRDGWGKRSGLVEQVSQIADANGEFMDSGRQGSEVGTIGLVDGDVLDVAAGNSGTASDVTQGSHSDTVGIDDEACS